ncbi:MAG TPA: hypothetical protein VGM43_14510 [Bryobacteraceae bacterium]|jgi:hypothetical protein
MSTHPNVILLLELVPDDLSNRARRAIMADCGVSDADTDLKIGGTDYHHRVMESDYDEDMQLSAREGSIVIYDLVTYGYGERIAWDVLTAQKAALEEWAKQVCEKHHCTSSIWITANYW